MKRYIIFFVFLFIAPESNAQKLKNITYIPVIEYPGKYEQDSFNSQKTYVRTFNDDSTFIDDNIFCGNNSEELQFKIDKKLNWFLKRGTKWDMFFSKNCNITYLFLCKEKMIISWKREWNIALNRYLYRMDIKNADRKHVESGRPLFYFDPESGIVLIIGHDYSLLRKDLL